MKGLYFQKSSTNEEITFVFQERVRKIVQLLNEKGCIFSKNITYFLYVIVSVKLV